MKVHFLTTPQWQSDGGLHTQDIGDERRPLLGDGRLLTPA